MSENIVPIMRGRPKDAGKRDNIFEAAKYLFLQRGFHGTSMDALAKQAGVSKATLYSHFEDKDAIYRALIENKMAAYEIDDFSAHVSWDMQADLEYMAGHLLDLVYDNEALEMLRMVIAETREGSDVPALFVEAGPRRVLDQMADYFTAQKKRGIAYLEDSAADAELFSSLVVGHAPMMFALTGVETPPDAAARKNRATQAVTRFLAVKKASAQT